MRSSYEYNMYSGVPAVFVSIIGTTSPRAHVQGWKALARPCGEFNRWFQSTRNVHVCVVARPRREGQNMQK